MLSAVQAYHRDAGSGFCHIESWSGQSMNCFLTSSGIHLVVNVILVSNGNDRGPHHKVALGLNSLIHYNDSYVTKGWDIFAHFAWRTDLEVILVALTLAFAAFLDFSLSFSISSISLFFFELLHSRFGLDLLYATSLFYVSKRGSQYFKLVQACLCILLTEEKTYSLRWVGHSCWYLRLGSCFAPKIFFC